MVKRITPLDMVNHKEMVTDTSELEFRDADVDKSKLADIQGDE